LSLDAAAGQDVLLCLTAADLAAGLCLPTPLLLLLLLLLDVLTGLA
jgi:hypothetical protein